MGCTKSGNGVDLVGAGPGEGLVHPWSGIAPGSTVPAAQMPSFGEDEDTHRLKGRETPEGGSRRGMGGPGDWEKMGTMLK